MKIDKKNKVISFDEGNDINNWSEEELFIQELLKTNNEKERKILMNKLLDEVKKLK